MCLTFSMASRRHSYYAKSIRSIAPLSEGNAISMRKLEEKKEEKNMKLGVFSMHAIISVSRERLGFCSQQKDASADTPRVWLLYLLNTVHQDFHDETLLDKYTQRSGK